MTDIRTAHDLLVQHAEETENTELAAAMHKLAVQEKWSEPTTAEIANNIRL